MYYVYIYKNPLKNDEPFYVGRGKDDRCKKHLLPYMLKKDNDKNKVIKEILSENLEPIIEIFSTGLTFTESNNLERKLISDFGRIKEGGTLTNITSGGQGLSGYEMSVEVREKIKKTMRENGVYDKISENMKGENNPMFGDKWHRSEEGKISFSEKMSGVYPMENKTDEEKTEIYNKISKTLKGRKLSDEQIEIRKKNSSENFPKQKKVKIIDIETKEEKTFISINLASKYLGISHSTLRYRYNKNIIKNNKKIEIWT